MLLGINNRGDGLILMEYIIILKRCVRSLCWVHMR